MLILFPDNRFLASTDRIEWRQPRLQPSPPVLAPTFSWERPRTNLYGSVFLSDQGFEMFYQCGNAMRIGRALSRDGLHWERPLVNPTNLKAKAHQIIQANDRISPASGPALQEGHELTNLVAGYHMPSVIHEPGSAAPYKLFAFGEAGYRTLQSSDGWHFEEYPDNPVIGLLAYPNPETRKTWFSDVAPCFRDRAGYTAMVKTYVIDDQGRTRRCVGRSTSLDFRHWSPVSTVWIPGAGEDAIARRRGFEWADFYGLCPFPWGQGYLGLLWLFEIEKELPQGTNQGKIEVFLAWSPDGLQWQRLSDEPLVPWDLNFGELGGMVTTPSAPVITPEGIWLYYSDSNYEHGLFEKDFTKRVEAPSWVIRCAQLPPERLVGATSDGGTLTLKPCDVAGRLRLNLDCGAEGELHLQWRDATGVRFTHTVRGVDATDHSVVLPELQQATLEIHLKQATLFALELYDAR